MEEERRVNKVVFYIQSLHNHVYGLCRFINHTATAVLKVESVGEISNKLKTPLI